jgi:hypothetical protein
MVHFYTRDINILSKKNAGQKDMKSSQGKANEIA